MRSPVEAAINSLDHFHGGGLDLAPEATKQPEAPKKSRMDAPGSSPKSVTASESLWMHELVSQRSFGVFARHRVPHSTAPERPTVLLF